MFTTIAMVAAFLGLVIAFVCLVLVVAQIVKDRSTLIPSIGFLLGVVLLTGGALAYPGNEAVGTPGLLSGKPTVITSEPAIAPASNDDNTENGSTAEDSGDTGEPENGEEPAPNEDTASSGNLGDYYVDIKNAVIAEDHDGNPAIVITYAWTNNSEETTSAEIALMEKAFQNGVQLSTAIIGNPSIFDSDLSFKDIRPGTTFDVQCAYELQNKDSVVEFELSELFGLSDEIVTKNFDPANLG